MASSLRSLSNSIRDRGVAAGRRLAATARASRQFLLTLLALLALLAFMAAAPIRSFDTANQRVESLEATKRQLTTSITDLERRKARLQDPQHIELLARTKFGLVKRGETPYVVVTPEEDLEADGEAGEGAGERAWYRWLFEAVVDMLPS